jgi:hypothetical protein
MTLRRWLTVARRTRTLPFDVEDVSELHVADATDAAYLAQLLADAKIDPALLEEVEALLGWRVTPGRPSVRKGEFGEVLSGAVMEEMHGYLVPVRKLRFQIDPEQTLPGNDLVCLKLAEDGNIESVLFVECKLRTRRDLPAGTDAHGQLVDDRDRNFADILTFIIARLYEQRSPLLPLLRDYLRDRGSEKHSYGISLVWEHEQWDERVIDRVATLDPPLKPLTVMVTRIASLSALVDDVFERAGVSLVDDEPA